MSVLKKVTYDNVRDAVLDTATEHGTAIVVGVLAAFFVRKTSQLKKSQYKEFVAALSFARARQRERLSR